MVVCFGNLRWGCPYPVENKTFYSSPPTVLVQCKPYQTLQSPPKSILMHVKEETKEAGTKNRHTLE